MSSSVSGGATITPNTLNAITEVLASSAMAASGINLSQPHPQSPLLVGEKYVSHEFPTNFVDTSPEELATIININVSATLHVTSLIAPSMASWFISSSLGVIS
ncbi:hypothetical protein V8E52_007658 [Russula decolorans]